MAVCALSPSPLENDRPPFPDLPSLREAGIPDYDVPQWHAFLALGKTPAFIINRLNAELIKALATPDIKQRLVAEGADVGSGTPSELAAQLASDIDVYTKFAQRLGLSLE